jgi:hypothetical protein
MNAISPNQIDPRILEELKRRQMMAQKAGILVGQNGGTAQPAPAMPAQPANPQMAQAAQVPTLVGREVGGGLGNRPGSGIPVGGDRESLSQWMKRQGGGSPMGGQSPMAGGAGPDVLQGSASTDAAPASAAIPKRPASGGGIFSRLGSGLNEAGNGIRNSLGGDFGSRLGDFMVGMGAGRTPQESLAYGAQNAMAGRQQRREDAKSEAEKNQTRRYAIMVGIPEDIAMNAPIPLLVEAIKQKMTPEKVEDFTLSPGQERYHGKEKIAGVPGEPKAPEKFDAITLVSPDGKMMSFDARNDAASIRRLLGLGWTERQGQGVNVNVDTGEKLPPGYMWQDPNDKTKGVKPIAGGPAEQIPAELAARVGLADSFLGQSGEVKKAAGAGDATGVIDHTLGSLGVGRAGDITRRIASGADALQRMLTGAGMPESEAKAYANRYMPTYTDTAESLTAKLDQLERELSIAKENALRGRGQTPQQPPGAPLMGSEQQPKQYRYNPQTGKIEEIGQ